MISDRFIELYRDYSREQVATSTYFKTLQLEQLIIITINYVQ